MEKDTNLYKTIAKKSDLDIMFIIENRDDYDKEFYCAAVKIGLLRGIVSRSDFDEDFLKELNNDITEIVARENAKPKKTFNHLLNGLYFLTGGLVLIVLNLLMATKKSTDFSDIKFSIFNWFGPAFIAILFGLLFIVIGLFKKAKNYSKSKQQ